jgi:GH24 family phage-related lysozyme (muramidase)
MRSFETFCLQDSVMHTEGIKDWLAAGMLATASLNNSGAEAKAVTQTQISPSFIDYLKQAENGVKKGWSGKIWLPHKSLEGGSGTIAYGHKIAKGEDFSRGITETQALELLKKDIAEASSKTEKLIDARYGSGTWSKLSPKQQNMLLDFTFNGGPGILKVFKKFTHGVVKNDSHLIKQNYQRFYKDVSGASHPLIGRNKMFAQRFLE